MENPPLEIKQEIPSDDDDDLNPADLLEITKEEFSLIDDFKTEINENFIGIHFLNQTEHEGTTEKLHYVIFNNSYRCTVCPFGTKRWKKVRLHYRIVHNFTGVTEAPFKMEYKELSIKLKDYLYEYCDTSFQCKVCKIKMLGYAKMKRHVDKLHVNVTNRCKVCNKTFMYSRQLKIHHRVHIKRQRKCYECGYTSFEPLTKHMEIHKDNIIYNCSLCSYNSCVKQEWINHRKSHSFKKRQRARLIAISKNLPFDYKASEKLFQCKLCKFKHYNRSSVKAHVNKAHLHIKRHQCKVCSKVYISALHLRRHRRIHIKKISTLPEPECGFPSSTPLIEHKKEVHVEDKIYHCSLCTYTTDLESYWTGHVKSHLNENPLPIIVSKDALYVYDPQKERFQCTLCEHYSFNHFRMKTHLNNIHKRCDTGEKPDESTECDYASSDTIIKDEGS